MSNTLPTAPPPPPQNVLRCASNRNNSTLSHSTSKKLVLDECLWSLEYPELQKACFLARICLNRRPQSCKFYDIESILQVGPTCGLTAVSMLLGGIPTAEHLLKEAKERNFSYSGEMFSAFQLYQLICDYLPCVNNNNTNRPANDLQRSNTSTNEDAEYSRKLDSRLECQLHEGRLNCVKIKEALVQGACLFVPYDPDYNHSPCLKMGHKAHWALIVGYLLSENGDFNVIARHGKAKNLAVWSLCSLSDSNANLNEFAQPKGYPDCDFLLPPGGISGNLGLRERAIIVQGLPLEITTIC